MAKTNKRDYITQILEVRGRLSPTSKRWNLVSTRMAKIEQVSNLLSFLGEVENIDSETLSAIFEVTPELGELEDYTEIRYELARYIPISLVACFEGYFRLVYANLINQRKPFRENVVKFEKKIDFGLEHLVSIERNSISLGEFVAHFLPCNTIEDINNNMSTITGQDFLRLVKRKYPELVPSLFPEMFTSEGMVVTIKQIFELRHMYCHELNPPLEEKDSSWVRFCKAASEFLLTSEDIVEEFLSSKEESAT